MARDYTWPMHMALPTPYNILKESFIYIVIHTRQSIVHMHMIMHMAEDIQCIVWPAVSTYYSHHGCMKFMH